MDTISVSNRIDARIREHYPYEVEIPGEFEEPEAWCVEQVGECGRIFGAQTRGGSPLIVEFHTDGAWIRYAWRFFFKDPALATAFRMVFG